MSGTPTISPDATGINDTAHARTGSVVDQLLAADAVATPDTIVHVPVKFVVPHPRNRKILDDDVADLVADFTNGGRILNPLGVTAAADWNANRPADLPEIGPQCFIITAGGHRRLRAAELAKLATVPCIVRADFAGSEGRRAALLENLHRQDLDPFQEAEAFAELVAEPYKLSQRDLAATVGVNQSHISKRLKLLKLPSTVRESTRLGKLTIADAVALAGVVDNKPVFADAMTKVQQWGWGGKQAATRAQEDYDAKVNRRKALQELADAGVTVIDRHPSYGLYGRTEPTRLDATGIKPEKHATEKCHAGCLDFNDKPILVCTHPGRHLPTGESTVKLTKKYREQLEQAASRGTGGRDDAEQRRQRRELKKTYPTRMEAAQRIVRGGHTLDDTSARELIRRGLVGSTFHSYTGRADTWKLVTALVGTIDGDYPQPQHTDKLIAKVPHEWVLLALALSHFEGLVRANNIRWDTEHRYYLNVLASQGYTISDVEHELLGDKRSIAGEWVPPTPEELEATRTEDEGSPCRVCGNRDAELEPGVTWVDENLCSACNDAAEAGWLDTDTTEQAQATPAMAG